MLKKITQWCKTIYIEDKNWEKYLLILLIVSIIPLIWIGRYNVMSADDYAMGKNAHQVWQSSHNILNMFQYSIKHTVQFYDNWQGCFTINYLDSWNPGYFGEKFTWITSISMLSMILVSLYILVKMLLKQFNLYSKSEAIVIWALLSFLIIQTMPAPVEGLYWYSGAIAYTFLHYFMFLFISLTLFREKKQGKVLEVLLLLASVILAFLLGGCQFTTVLVSLIFYALFLLLKYKNFKLDRLLPGIALLGGFLVSFLSPGNSIRQGNTTGMSPISAILNSFLEAIVYGKRWISPLFIVILLFLFPVIWNLLKKTAAGQFKYCFPVLLFSFCVFASAFTPSLYGVGNVNSGRILNQIQVLYYLIVVFDYFYCIGWLRTKIGNSVSGVYYDLGCILHIASKYVVVLKWSMLILLVMIWIGTGDKNTFSGISALRSLVIGEARTYHNESEIRLDQYLDETKPVVEVTPYSVQPKVLFFNDVKPEGDVDYWINENIAAYYQKEKVVLKK